MSGEQGRTLGRNPPVSGGSLPRGRRAVRLAGLQRAPAAYVTHARFKKVRFSTRPALAGSERLTTKGEWTMKKEYQYLVAGALISAAVLMGMGIAGEEKQTTEGRYQFIEGGGIASVNPQYQMYSEPVGGTVTNKNLFLVIDSQTGTVNYVDQSGQVIALPFAATKAEQSNGS